MATTHIVDEKTKRLMELTQVDGNDRMKDLHEIISIVNLKLPKLFDGLSDTNREKIANALQIKSYAREEIVFLQNDLPDAYYSVVRGAVSLYVLRPSIVAANKAAYIGHTREKYGKLLTQLPPGTSFGELSFNENGVHSRRNAGVISDGNQGQRMVRKEGSMGKNETMQLESSDVAVLLLIPENVYMAKMFARHKNKQQTKEKITFLQGSFLFNQWSMDQHVKMAYSMKKKEYSTGSVVTRQGDRAELIYFVKSGGLSIVQKITSKTDKKVGTMSGYQKNLGAIIANTDSEQHDVCIAELGSYDIFGVLEMLGNSKKMKREAVASSNSEIFIVQANVFASFLKQEINTASLITRLVEKRVKWENFRREYASRFYPVMPLELPKNAEKMSLYAVSKKSTMSEKEFIVHNRQDKELFQMLREARLSYGTIMLKLRKYKSKSKSRQKETLKEILNVKNMFSRILSLAEEIEDRERSKLANNFLQDLEQIEKQNSLPITGNLKVELSSNKVIHTSSSKNILVQESCAKKYKKLAICNEVYNESRKPKLSPLLTRKNRKATLQLLHQEAGLLPATNETN